MYTYVFQPLVHPPWGEMTITLVTVADNWLDAQRQCIKELHVWKESQRQLRRNDYPWLDEAIKYVFAMQGPTALIKNGQVGLFWYHEKE